VGISYRDTFTAEVAIPVLAGLTPVNASVVDLIPSIVLSTYLMQLSFGILATSKYVTGISSSTCKGNDCTAVFLPGGVEIARMRTRNLNSTLLSGTQFSDSPAIIISNAPGYQLEFFPIEPGYVFDPDNCTIFGKERGQGFMLCLASNQSTLLAGHPSNSLLNHLQAGAFALLLCLGKATVLLIKPGHLQSSKRHR
jgi:hypothetical protein